MRLACWLGLLLRAKVEWAGGVPQRLPWLGLRLRAKVEMRDNCRLGLGLGSKLRSQLWLMSGLGSEYGLGLGLDRHGGHDPDLDIIINRKLTANAQMKADRDPEANQKMLDLVQATEAFV